jgi:hypothetical protein
MCDAPQCQRKLAALAAAQLVEKSKPRVTPKAPPDAMTKGISPRRVRGESFEDRLRRISEGYSLPFVSWESMPPKREKVGDEDFASRLRRMRGEWGIPDD